MLDPVDRARVTMYSPNSHLVTDEHSMRHSVRMSQRGVSIWVMVIDLDGRWVRFRLPRRGSAEFPWARSRARCEPRDCEAILRQGGLLHEATPWVRSGRRWVTVRSDRYRIYIYVDTPGRGSRAVSISADDTEAPNHLWFVTIISRTLVLRHILDCTRQE